jgi:hypothetical protein
MYSCLATLNLTRLMSKLYNIPYSHSKQNMYTKHGRMHAGRFAHFFNYYNVPFLNLCTCTPICDKIGIFCCTYKRGLKHVIYLIKMNVELWSYDSNSWSLSLNWCDFLLRFDPQLLVFKEMKNSCSHRRWSDQQWATCKIRKASPNLPSL